MYIGQTYSVLGPAAGLLGMEAMETSSTTQGYRCTDDDADFKPEFTPGGGFEALSDSGGEEAPPRGKAPAHLMSLGRNNAPKSNSARAAEQLLRDIKARSPELQLAHAVARGNAEEVEALLIAGASTGAADPQAPGWTPLLHVAAELGYVRILTLLLSRGADTTARDQLTDTTPLLWASFCGQAECVAALLEWGGPTHPDFPHRHLDKDLVGRTSLALARLHQHKEVEHAITLHLARVRVEQHRQHLFELSRQVRCVHVFTGSRVCVTTPAVPYSNAVRCYGVALSSGYHRAAGASCRRLQQRRGTMTAN